MWTKTTKTNIDRSEDGQYRVSVLSSVEFAYIELEDYYHVTLLTNVAKRLLSLQLFERKAFHSAIC